MAFNIELLAIINSYIIQLDPILVLWYGRQIAHFLSIWLYEVAYYCAIIAWLGKFSPLTCSCCLLPMFTTETGDGGPSCPYD